jgi:signal transduction histidine kinase
MFIGFGLLFAALSVSFFVIERYGLPFSGFEGHVEEKRTEAFKSLSLTADLIKARRAVQESHDQLNKALKEKNEELEQVINVTSHDLRSPLVNIHGFSRELEHLAEEAATLSESPEIPPHLAERLHPILSEQVPEALSFILRGASRMDRLIKGLLRLSRLGRAALEIKPLDMNLLLSEVIGVFSYQVQKSGASIEIGPLPPCLGDEVQVNQVFSNLLDTP